MKRTLSFTAILFLTSLSALAQDTGARRPEMRRFANPLLNDVVEMTRAQLPEATIVAYVRARRSRLDADVSAGDLIRLHRSGVSDGVIRYIASAAGIDERGWDRDGDRDRDRDRDRVREMDRDRDQDSDSDGVVAWNGDRDGDDDGGVQAYPQPYGGVYDGWYGWPYWYGYSPFFWDGGIVFRGGRRFHGGGGDHHSGGSRHDDGNHGGTRGGGSHSGGSHSGGSHSGGSHSGGSHGGSHH